jgi:hypothetical protein
MAGSEAASSPFSWASGSEADANRAALILSLLSLALGLWIFWTHGGRRISAVGIWGFAFALFVGFAGMYALSTSRGGAGLVGALSAAYFIQVCLWGLWSYPPGEEAQRDWVADPGVLKWGVLTGAAVLIVSSLLFGRVGAGADTFLEAAAFVSVVLVTASSSFKEVVASGLVMAAAAFFVYAAFVALALADSTGTLGLAIISFYAKFPARSMRPRALGEHPGTRRLGTHACRVHGRIEPRPEAHP